MLTSAKSSSTKSFSYNESPRSSVSSSFSDSTFFLQRNTQEEEEEFVAPINIYHEHRNHIEEDKKARTELDTEILDDDLYCPVQQREVNNTTSKEFNTENFNSLFPQFSFSSNNYGRIMESNETVTWDYNVFNTTNNMFGTDIVACQ